MIDTTSDTSRTSARLWEDSNPAALTLTIRPRHHEVSPLIADFDDAPRFEQVNDRVEPVADDGQRCGGDDRWRDAALTTMCGGWPRVSIVDRPGVSVVLLETACSRRAARGRCGEPASGDERRP
jgi:hypothetical protein